MCGFFLHPKMEDLEPRSVPLGSFFSVNGAWVQTAPTVCACTCVAAPVLLRWHLSLSWTCVSYPGRGRGGGHHGSCAIREMEEFVQVDQAHPSLLLGENP